MRRRYTGFSRRSQTRSLSDSDEVRDNPLVSILIRTRNRPIFLREAVESVVNQDYRPVEVVVVNDGGDDPSSVLASLGLKGISLRLVNLPKRMGRSFAANRAFKESSGKYVNFLDDDDILLPNHVSTLVDVLENQHRRVVYTACEMVEMEMLPNGTWRQSGGVLKKFSTPFDENRILFENFIPFMTLMMDREAFYRYLLAYAAVYPDGPVARHWHDLGTRLDEAIPHQVPFLEVIVPRHVTGEIVQAIQHVMESPCRHHTHSTTTCTV